MSESSSSSSSVDTGIPVVETVENIFVKPSVLACNTIHDTELLAELPFVGGGIARPVVKSNSFSDTSISFNHSVNVNDIIDRGITFEIEQLVLSYNAQVGLIRQDNSSVTALDSAAQTDLATANKSISFSNAKIGLKNFASCIESVTCNFGNGFSFTVSDAGILNEILPFYSAESEHKYNPPLRLQRGFLHSPEINTDIITTKADKDYFTSGGTSLPGPYNPFNIDSSFPIRRSISGGVLLHDGFGAGTPSDGGKVLVGSKTSNVNIVFNGCYFSIPSDIFRENIRLDETGLYGLSTLDITITLNPRRIKELLITPSDYATAWSIVRDGEQKRVTVTVGGNTYIPVYKFNEFKTFFGGSGGSATSPQVSMYLTKRTPISAVEAEMKRNGDFKLPFKEYRVSKHNLTGKLTGSSATAELTSRDITLETMPSQLLFCYMKTDNVTGDLGFARVDNAKISINSRDTVFSSTRDLYNISCANGYFSTYHDFASATGSVCCVDTTSLNIGSDTLVGESSSVNISITAKMTRIDVGYSWGDSDSNDYQLVVVAVYDKVVVRKDGNFTIQSGYRMTDQAKGAITYDQLATILRAPVVYGSGFFSRVWRGIKKLPSIVSKASDLVGKYNPAIGKYANIAQNLIGGRKSSHIIGGASVNSDAHLFMR